MKYLFKINDVEVDGKTFYDTLMNDKEIPDDLKLNIRKIFLKKDAFYVTTPTTKYERQTL